MASYTQADSFRLHFFSARTRQKICLCYVCVHLCTYGVYKHTSVDSFYWPEKSFILVSTFMHVNMRTHVTYAHRHLFKHSFGDFFLPLNAAHKCMCMTTLNTMKLSSWTWEKKKKKQAGAPSSSIFFCLCAWALTVQGIQKSGYYGLCKFCSIGKYISTSFT